MHRFQKDLKLLVLGSCPKGCSGHGFCTTINDVSYFKGPDYDQSLETGGDGYGSEYQNWDKDSIQMCDCEEGYFGPDCSLGKLS